MTDQQQRVRRQGASDPLSAARDLLRRGIMPLPIKPGKKNPTIPGWQNLTIDATNVDRYFSGADLNVGGRMGAKSGGLVDVDLDSAVTMQLAPRFLPRTEAVYGRDGKPKSHWLYRCDPDDLESRGSFPFHDAGGSVIVELRIGGGAKGAQSVMPGSVHSSGELVRWDSDGVPAQVDYAHLKMCVQQLAVAAVLLEHFTGDRVRHDRSLGVGGFLARAGWPEEAIARVIEVICALCGSQNVENHATSAGGAVAALAAGEHVRGYPWLQENLGEAVAKRLAKIVGFRTVAPEPEPVSEDGLPVVKLIPGHLPRIADRAEAILVAGSAKFFERADMLVRPIVKEVDSFHGRKTHVAHLVKIDRIYMRDELGRAAAWVKLDKRERRWSTVDAPFEVADTILARAGRWTFPTVAGIATAPTLRPDASILRVPGYDAATRLFLVESVQMPEIAEHPTKDDAIAALNLFLELLNEFPFVDEIAKVVAVSIIVTAVARGAFPVAPMHVADAPVAGSGKSYLFDTTAAIVLGQPMPVISAGKTEEELEKRLGAAVVASQPLICIDNVSGVLRGDALAQLIERPRPRIRILGRSELIEVEAKGTTLFANGNNIIIGGDLTRRAVRCRLDPQMERPELRQFTGDPVAKVLADRGKYLAAALTICRAYAVAGRPGRCPRLASFEGWSDAVRSALTWLGMEDPVDSMEQVREDDPDTGALRAVLEAWSSTFGIGRNYRISIREVVAKANQTRTDAGTQVVNYVNEDLRSAILTALGGGRQVEADSLRYWIRGKKDRIIAEMKFDYKHDMEGGKWWIVKRVQGHEVDEPPGL
jgi:hypothetical protein